MRQAFEVTAAQTSGPVNLVFFRQSGLFDGHNQASQATRPARPGFETVSYQDAAHAQQRSLVTRVFLEYAKIEQAKERLLKGFPVRSFCRPK